MFAGERQDLVSLLSCADLFLLPSAQESFGMAALEAMACEVPVVASRVGGLPEVIDDGVTGFLCEPADLDGMAERGVEVLMDAARHERIAFAGAIAVRTRFCTDAIVPLYEDTIGRFSTADDGPDCGRCPKKLNVKVVKKATAKHVKQGKGWVTLSPAISHARSSSSLTANTDREPDGYARCRSHSRALAHSEEGTSCASSTCT